MENYQKRTNKQFCFLEGPHCTFGSCQQNKDETTLKGYLEMKKTFSAFGNMGMS